MSEPTSESGGAVKAPAPAEPDRPAKPAKPAAPAPAPRRIASTAAGSLAARAGLVVAGLCMVAGFFMPWLKLGGLASISGFGLMSTEGEVVELLSGFNRFLLFAVPTLGVLLIAGGVTGHRAAAWLALVTGAVVIGDGLVTLMVLFLSTTGSGMWLVILGAFVALAIGLLTLGHHKKG